MRLIHMQIHIMMIPTLGIHTLGQHVQPIGLQKIPMLHPEQILMPATRMPETHTLELTHMPERGQTPTLGTLMLEKEILTLTRTQPLFLQDVR